MIQFKKLRWKNFLSTGDTFTEIELDKHPTSLIIGENGSGKSTMLDALTFVLFSKPFRRVNKTQMINTCLLYTSPSPRDRQKSRMPSSA